MTSATTTGPAPSGLELLRDEMGRQDGDALASLTGNAALAARIAASARQTGRLLLIGMGASHFVNRAAEPVYRGLGIDASAVTASELLAAPLPDRPRTAVLTSQSGASGEILQLLERPAGQEQRFGITLEAASPLARAVPCLIGAGGMERAFAATRSLLVTLALHAALLEALGLRIDEIRQLLKAPPRPAVVPAIDRLTACGAVILSGRGVLAGIAEAGALCLMELGRLPALALEGGQFRHGPLEVLAPGIGVILLRDGGVNAAAAVSLAKICAAAGAPPVVLDASGEPALPSALTVALPRHEGFAAGLAMLPALQELLIGLAARRVPRVGEPLRSTKVTGIE
jgi:fructoselysine-6-P-deglycase FrlB-like protein